MELQALPLVGLICMQPVRHGDQRGFFAETYNQERYVASGLNANFVQDNHSVSTEVGTLRGLHFHRRHLADSVPRAIPR